VAEQVDAQVSKICSLRSVGSSPTEGTKIIRVMNTKILDKITSQVRFRTKVLRDGKIEYFVERKNLEDSGWNVIAKTTKLERALVRKHNAWLAQLSKLNYTGKLLNRRKLGKGTLLQLFKR
jgi:hypothetical protein